MPGMGRKTAGSIPEVSELEEQHVLGGFRKLWKEEVIVSISLGL